MSGSRSGKSNMLLNLNISDQMLTKFISTSKISLNQSIDYSSTKKEKVQIKRTKNQKFFIHYQQTIDNVYENLAKYNPTKAIKKLMFDESTADMESNKKLRPIGIKLFLNAFKTQYFTCFYISF